METSFLSVAKSNLRLILHIFLTALFGLLTCLFWSLYQQEKLAIDYAKEGKPIMIAVSSYHTDQQHWLDYLQNARYIRFVYAGKSYETRYIQDSIVVLEGTTLTLLYHPAYDAFQQPQQQVYTNRINTSKLINWTSVKLLSKENIALLSFCLVTAAFFFLLAGLLSRIAIFYFIKNITDTLFKILLFIGAVYITYNALAYYRYYHHIKSSGQLTQVTVLDKEQHSQVRKGKKYTPYRIIYTATILYQNAERIIPVSEDDFNSIHKGSQLHVLYNKELDDMMAADYKMNPLIFIGTSIIWIILLFAGNIMYRKWKQRTTREQS